MKQYIDLSKTSHALRLCSSLLLLMILLKWHFGYYFVFLRYIVSVTFIYLVFATFAKNLKILSVIFIGMILLFNPVIPVHFKKDIWVVIDVVTSITILSSFFWMKSYENGR